MQGEIVRRYVWVKDFVKDKRVIDVGCGYGYGTNYLAEFAGYILGIDSDAKAIEFARSNYKTDFKVVDITEPHDLGKFDVVISFEVIEHVNKPEAYIAFVSRLLLDNGLFILSTPNKLYKDIMYEHKIAENPFHEREYYPDELSSLLQKSFNIETYGEIYLDGDIDKLVKNAVYMKSCRVPSGIRKFIPKSLKDRFVKSKGLDIPRLEDYHIVKTENLSAKYFSQIYVCSTQRGSISCV